MLQFITHHTDRYDEIAGTRAVLEGGCRWVQLRMKDTPAEEVLRIGREIEKLCREYGAKFILDDHVELVRELNADGVHLGKLDMPVAEARRLLGPEYRSERRPTPSKTSNGGQGRAPTTSASDRSVSRRPNAT